MRAGRLDRRVAVQRFTATQSPSGEPIETWSTIGVINRWASKTPIAGVERYGAQELEAKEQVEFRLRWSNELADLQPADRIVEPASDAIEPVPLRSIYDIFAVLEINRREGLRVLTIRRPTELPAETIEVTRIGVGHALGIGGAYLISEAAENYVEGFGTAYGGAEGNAIGALIQNAIAASAGISSGAMAGHEVRGTAGAATGAGAAAAVGAIAWVNDFITPAGIVPSIVLDFANGRYFNGTVGTATLASLLNNAAGLIDANGLNISGHTDLTSNGAFTTAVQQTAGTIWVETISGDGATAGVVAFTSGSPDGPILIDAGQSKKIFAFPTNLYSQAPPVVGTPWSGIMRSVSGWDGSGRRLALNDGFTGGSTASDAIIYTARGQAVLGSYAGGAQFNGHIRRLVMWPSKLAADDMLAVSWPSKYLFPLTRYHMVKFRSGFTDTMSIGVGLLQFEKTQPWTMACEFIGNTGLGGVIFSNVITGPPWYGYEVWVPSTGKIRVHLMSGWGGGAHTDSLEVDGSTTLVANTFYRIMVSYDGSGVAAGIKIYVNGVLETNTVNGDALGTTIIAAPAAMYFGSQFGGGFQVGWIGAFQLSNVVRSAAYATALNAGDRAPGIDANHVLSFKFREGAGTTTADESINNYTGTLSSSTLWNIW